MKEIKTTKFSNGFVSLLELDNGEKIETTSTCLPLSTELRDSKLSKNINIPEENCEDFNFWHEKWMIGISTQSGCPIRCKFCATNKITQKYGWRNLSSDEMIKQIEYAVQKTEEIFHYKGVRKTKLFRILTTRMGEPSLNIKNIIDAIWGLKTLIPSVRIQVSTIGLKESVKLVDELIKLEDYFGQNWLELQFSIHSTDYSYRQWLQCKNVLTNEEINKLGQRYYNYFPNRKWKPTLNFSLSKETPFDAKKLAEQFDKNTFFVKISPINENVVSDKFGLKSLFQYENKI